MKKIGFFFFCLLLLSACREKELDMTVLNKTMFEDVAFTEIVAEDAWNVIVVQDDQRTGVELEYSAFLEEYLSISKEGQKLNVAFTQRLNLPDATVKNATVYVSSLEKISLIEAASMTLQGEFHAESLTLSLKDKATLRGGNLFGDLEMDLDGASTVVDLVAEGAQCHLDLKNASVFKGTVTATAKLDVDADGGSRFTTYGGASPHAEVDVDNASFLNMVQTLVENMDLQVKNASEASVNVITLLEGSASNASTVFYQGHPNILLECDNTSSIYPL